MQDPCKVAAVLHACIHAKDGMGGWVGWMGGMGDAATRAADAAT